jgi:hypothetical protein
MYSIQIVWLYHRVFNPTAIWTRNTSFIKSFARDNFFWAFALCFPKEILFGSFMVHGAACGDGEQGRVKKMAPKGQFFLSYPTHLTLVLSNELYSSSVFFD